METMTPDGQVVLEEEVDENYEPTETEVLEYAQWLGMDVEEEQELMWIAKEGLKAPLPSSWKPCKTPTADIYYFNFSTGESIWDHPCDEFYRKLYQEEKTKLSQRKASAGPGSQQNTGRGVSANGGNSGGGGALSSGGGAKQPRTSSPTRAAAGAGTLGPLRELRTSTLGDSSLQSSFDAPIGAHPLGGISPKPLGLPAPLGPIKALGTSGDIPSLTKKPLGAAASPASASATVGSLGLNSKPVLGGGGSTAQSTGGSLRVSENGGKLASLTQNISQEWAGSPSTVGGGGGGHIDREDSEYERSVRSRHDEERGAVERRLKADFEAEREDLEKSYRSRLASLRKDLEDDHTSQRRKIEANHEELVGEFKRTMQLREEREKGDATLEQRRRIAELERTHDDALASIRREKAAAEEDARREAAQVRSRRLEEAEQEVDLEVERAVAARRGDVAATAGALNSQQQQLTELQAQLEERRSALKVLNADVSAKEARLAAADDDLAVKTAAAAQAAQTRDAALAATAAVSAAASAGAGAAAAASAGVSTLALADAEQRAERAEAKAKEAGQKLEEAERKLAEAAEKLAGVGGGGGVDPTLRGRAESEYQQLEEELARARQDLDAVSMELEARASDVRAYEMSLNELEQSVSERGRHADVLADQVAESEARLAEVEAQLSNKRAQLDRVATMLLNRRADMSAYDEKARSLSAEESSMLEVRRAQMERSVEASVSTERRQLLDACSAAMRTEVEKAMAAERLALSGGLQAALQNSRAAGGGQRVVVPHAVDMGLSNLDDVQFGDLPSAKGGRGERSDATFSSEGQTSPLAAASVRLQASITAALSQAVAQASAAPAGSQAQAQHEALVAQSVDGLARLLHASAAQGGHANGTGTSLGVGGGGGGGGNAWAAPRTTNRATHQQQQQQQQGGGAAEAAVLARARFFLKQQKRYIKERQAMLQVAREEWRVSMASVPSIEDPVARSRQALALQQVKGSLDEQIRMLNADAGQLSELKAQLSAQESGASMPRPPTLEDLPLSMHPGGGGSMGFNASLDQISRAVNRSLAAVSPFEPPHAAYFGAGGRPGASVGTSYGGGGSFGMGGAYGGGFDGMPPGGNGLSFLSRWRDEQEVAQALLRQHSAWLRGFREQIGRASVALQTGSFGGSSGGAGYLQA